MRRSCWLIVAGSMLALGCHEELYHGLDERAANLTVAGLERAGIPASKAREPRSGFTVSVPTGSVSVAMETLERQGLPPKRIEGMELLFEHESLVPSPAEERARIQFATAQEVRRTLAAIGGVREAQVSLVLPGERRGLRDATPGRAGVVLDVASPDTVDVGDVRRIVSSAVRGLAPTDVEVVVTNPEADTCAEPTPTFARVGPFAVAVGSKEPLLAAFAVLLSTLMVLGSTVVFLARRTRP